jgi:hypothetical protein
MLAPRSNLAPGDDGKKKVGLLAFYFEYGTQSASLVTVCFTLTIFLFAFGVSLSSAMRLQTGTLIIVVTLMPIVVLVLSLAWFALAQGYLPTKCTPASISERLSGGTTLWLDKTCADQNNLAGFLEQGIDFFMLRCDRLVAFSSKSCARQAATSNASLVVTPRSHTHVSAHDSRSQTLPARGASLSWPPGATSTGTT